MQSQIVYAMSRAPYAIIGFAIFVSILTAKHAYPQDLPDTGTAPLFWPVAATLLSVVALIALGAWFGRPNNAASRCSSHQVETFVDLVSSGVVGLDANQNVVMVNPAGRRMLGGISKVVPFTWPSNIQFSLEGQRADLFPDDLQSPLSRALTNQPLDGETFLMNRVARHEKPRKVRLSSMPIENVDGDLKTLIVMDDISDLANSGKSEVKLGQIDVFSALAQGVTNDYSNALETISYAIDSSLKQPLPEKAASHLMTALGTIEKGRSLTRKVMLLARQQDGQVSSRSVMSMLEDFQTLLPSSIDENVKLAVKCMEPGLLVRCNQAELEDALLTLVLNGCDAILSHAQSGTVTVSAQLAEETDSVLQLRELHGTQSDFVELIVSDDGPGMTEEISKQISNPLAVSEIQGQDIGDGLAKVRSFVTHAGGHLRVEQNQPKGTSVCIVLPLERDDHELPADWQSPLPNGGGETVLVVEDDAMMLLMLQEALEELGYRVISATSGAAALSLVEQGVELDLVITDIIMPGDINGFDLVRQVRRLSKKTSVLYISGYTEFSETVRGALDAPLLTKPCATNELANAVKAVLGTRPV